MNPYDPWLESNLKTLENLSEEDIQHLLTMYTERYDQIEGDRPLYQAHLEHWIRICNLELMNRKA